MVERDGLAPLTPATIAAPQALWPELARVRARGFAWEEREHTDCTCAVAAPIFDRPGSAVAALGLSAPAQRWEAHVEDYTRALVITAAHISRRVCRRAAALDGGDGPGVAAAASGRA